MTIKNKQDAFTLIELSISLTVIALIIGSTLTIKKIKDNASLNSIMSDVSRLTNAYYSFSSIYKAIPGDIFNATDVFGNSQKGISVINGNGNDVINNNTETVAALQHLSLAGLITGNFSASWNISNNLTYLPSTIKLGADGFYFANLSIKNFSSLYVVAPSNIKEDSLIIYAKIIDDNKDQVINFPNEATNAALSPLDIYKIDTKYDDGYPLTGRIIAASPTAANIETCINNNQSPRTYLSSNLVGCYLGIVITNKFTIN